LLGLPPVPRERDDDLLHRRDASFRAVQEHYYPDLPGSNADGGITWPLPTGNGMKQHCPFRK
jgi:hypothetical protein